MLAKSNPIDGTVISADFQTRGKGQRDHNWQSEANKNLLLSIILYPPQLTAEDQFYISMMTTNAITSFLQTFLPPERLWIKWPNDLYVDDKKLGGILIQNNLKGINIESSVLGIGLNINQNQFDPKLPNPTSLSSETGLTYELDQMKPALLRKLDEAYRLLISREFQLIKKQYETRLYRKGRLSKINTSSGIVEGTILGIETDGRLLVNIDGKLKKITH